MASKAELIEWLNTLPDDAEIGIDEGGVALTTDDGAYFEMGGWPEGGDV